MNSAWELDENALREEDAGGAGELIDYVRTTAIEIGSEQQNRLLSAVAALMMREAHLAVERAHSSMSVGVPPETAFFLAVDDMGFQLAHGAAQGWAAGKEADRQRTG